MKAGLIAPCFYFLPPGGGLQPSGGGAGLLPFFPPLNLLSGGGNGFPSLPFGGSDGFLQPTFLGGAGGSAACATLTESNMPAAVSAAIIILFIVCPG